jgi:hypothetical protein
MSSHKPGLKVSNWISSTRHSNKFAFLGFLVLWGTLAQAQVKDMPSQAEFDPILENAENKLKDFVATLTKFRSEAMALDEKKLTEDLEAIRNTQQVLQVTRGSGAMNGLNMTRLVGLLSAIDDITLDAALWATLASLKVCEQSLQKGQNPTSTRYVEFSFQVSDNQKMLAEVGRQMFHPTFRFAGAADEIILMVLDPPKSNAGPR